MISSVWSRRAVAASHRLTPPSSYAFALSNSCARTYSHFPPTLMASPSADIKKSPSSSSRAMTLMAMASPNLKRSYSNYSLTARDPNLKMSWTQLNSRPGGVPCRHFSPISTIQDGITQLHELTSLPWCASIALSALFVRLGLFVVTRKQIIASQKLSKAAHEISLLNELLAKSVGRGTKNTWKEKKLAMKTYWSGFRASMKIHDVSLAPVVLPPLFNLGVFFLFVYSVRDLLTLHDVSNGGAFWFQDLKEADSTMLLPFIALSCTYTSLEITMQNANDGTFLKKLKDIFQTCTILFLPLSAQLPCGVFCYWIPSSVFIIIQSLLLRNDNMRKVLRIPPVTGKPSAFPVPGDVVKGRK